MSQHISRQSTAWDHWAAASEPHNGLCLWVTAVRMDGWGDSSPPVSMAEIPAQHGAWPTSQPAMSMTPRRFLSYILMKISWGGCRWAFLLLFNFSFSTPHGGGMPEGGGRGCGQLNFFPAKHPSGIIQECPDSHNFFGTRHFFGWGLVDGSSLKPYQNSLWQSFWISTKTQRTTVRTPSPTKSFWKILRWTGIIAHKNTVNFDRRFKVSRKHCHHIQHKKNHWEKVKMIRYNTFSNPLLIGERGKSLPGVAFL